MSRTCTRCQQAVPDGDLLCRCQVVNDETVRADVIARVERILDKLSRSAVSRLPGGDEVCTVNRESITIADLRALLTAYAQVTAERDAAEARAQTMRNNGLAASLLLAENERLTTALATLRADLAAQVEMVRKLEWSASTPCQYAGSARTCPSCRGIDPSDTGNASSFVAAYIGHRAGCELAARILRGPHAD